MKINTIVLDNFSKTPQDSVDLSIQHSILKKIGGRDEKNIVFNNFIFYYSLHTPIANNGDYFNVN